MSASTAELTLILKAQNLADSEFNKIKTALSNVAVTAGVVAGDMAAAFKGVGRRIANQMGNLAQDILSGGNVGTSLLAVGATMAGAMVEGLMAHLIPGLLAKLAATATFGPIAAALTTEGTTLGGVIAAAIPAGMALLAVGIAAAAVAALVYLATNPEALQKAREIGQAIVKAIGEGLAALGKVMHDRFFAGLGAIGDAVLPDNIRQMLHDQGVPGYAIGGIVPGPIGAPQLAVVHGGERVSTPAQQRSAGGGLGVRLMGVSEADILDMVDRGLYFRLQRSAPILDRS